MARELRPCGTHAAYARHLRNNEEPCGPCKAANLERVYNAPSGKAREIDPRNREIKAMDRLLAERPPQIEWRKDRRGIFRAVSVDDPHTETANQRKRDQEFALFLDAEFAPQPAEPECMDADLLSAARTEL